MERCKIAAHRPPVTILYLQVAAGTGARQGQGLLPSYTTLSRPSSSAKTLFTKYYSGFFGGCGKNDTGSVSIGLYSIGYGMQNVATS